VDLIEGTLALTGQYFQTDNLEQRGILPGHLKAFNLISRDEHRHVAYGTWFLQQKARDPELAREIGVSDATIYTWKSKYGGMDVSDAQKLKGLEDENRRLKHLVADLSLDKEVLKAVIRKNGWSLPA
jgi:putative transposase